MEHVSQSSRELLARFQAGEAGALDTLVQRYYPRVRRMVAVRLGAALRVQETIDDVVQDAFVRIVKAARDAKLDCDGSWIDSVARMIENEIRNHARRHRAIKRGAGMQPAALWHGTDSGIEVAAQTTAIHHKAGNAEETARLDATLATLREEHREVILLRDYAGCDWQTVAQRMGRVSAEACQELRRRACRELGTKWMGATDSSR